MWIALSIAGGLAGLVLLLALIGRALPRGHVAARKATFTRPPAAVWEALTSLDAQPSWRKGLTRIERLSPTRFREHGRHGATTYELAEAAEPSLRITRIADDQLPYGGRWIYELAPSGDGTSLTITEDGFIKNPVFRVLSRTVFSTTATIEQLLRDLGAHLGSPATVEEAAPSARAAGPDRA